MEPLPAPMLRKYIAYARKYCFPQIGSAARAVLEDFYLALRERRYMPIMLLFCSGLYSIHSTQDKVLVILTRNLDVCQAWNG